MQQLRLLSIRARECYLFEGKNEAEKLQDKHNAMRIARAQAYVRLSLLSIINQRYSGLKIVPF